MARPSKYSPELRERAVRMVQEHAAAHALQLTAKANTAKVTAGRILNESAADVGACPPGRINRNGAQTMMGAVMPRRDWDSVEKERRERRNGVEWIDPEGQTGQQADLVDSSISFLSKWREGQEAQSALDAATRGGAPTHLKNLEVLVKYYGGSTSTVMEIVKNRGERRLKRNAAGVYKPLPERGEFAERLGDETLARLIAERLSTWDET